MKPICAQDAVLNSALVTRWEARYPLNYDAQHYTPWLRAARSGDPVALERITEWKNVGSSCRPMRLSAKKLHSFHRFLNGLPNYRRPNGRAALQAAFARNAPVYSIFWSHVLYDSPIFDVYTNIAYNYFCLGARLTKQNARISAPNHWQQYASYESWFFATLRRLQVTNMSIGARTLDRALFKWGQYYGT